MSVKQFNNFIAAADLIRLTLHQPASYVISAWGNIKEIAKYRDELDKEYGRINFKNKALLYSEFGLNCIAAIIATIKFISQAIIFCRTLSVKFFLSNVIYVSQSIALVQLLSNAAILAKQHRFFRDKKMQIDNLELLFEELVDKINDDYMSYKIYFGNGISYNKNLFENVKVVACSLKEHDPLSDLLSFLRLKTLSELIAEQSWSAYHDNNIFIPLVNIYQIVIDEKINEINLDPDEDIASLKQYIIAKQHQYHYKVARLILQKSKNHHALRGFFAIICLACSIVIACASLGVASPIIGLAFVNFSMALGVIMQIHEKFLSNMNIRERSITEYLSLQTENIFNEDASLDNLYTMDIEICDRLADILTNIIYNNFQNFLSIYLKSIVESDEYQHSNSFEKILLLKIKIHKIKSNASFWKKISIQQHTLYKLINNINTKNLEGSLSTTKDFIEEQDLLIIKRNRRKRLYHGANRNILFAKSRLDMGTSRASFKTDLATLSRTYF